MCTRFGIIVQLYIYRFRGRFCGGTLPASIQSSGNEMFVTFASDASGFATGFQARYATKKDSHDAGMNIELFYI